MIVKNLLQIVAEFVAPRWLRAMAETMGAAVKLLHATRNALTFETGHTIEAGSWHGRYDMLPHVEVHVSDQQLQPILEIFVEYNVLNRLRVNLIKHHDHLLGPYLVMAATNFAKPAV